MSTKQSDNVLIGTSGDDRLNGGQGDDVLVGAGGNDYLDGGPGGYDTAVYSGNYADYTITFSAGPSDSQGYKITVVDNRAGSPDGTDTLRRIEAIKFADGEFSDGRFHPNGPGAKVTAITALSADTGASNSDFITSQAAQTVSGTFSGSLRAGDVIQVSANGSTWVNATISGSAWSANGVTLAAGSGSLVTQTLDSAGHALTGATRAYVLDTTAAAPGLVAAFVDSGASATDKITSATAATLSGTAEAGATVNVYDASTLIGTVTANSTGQWTYGATGLANGTHSFTAEQTDVAGNVSAASEMSAMTVDTAAPSAPSLSAVFTDSGVVGDKITNATTAALSGMAEAGATVKVYDGSTLIATVTANATTGAWSYNATGLINGTHNFTAKQTDIAGNVSAASETSTMTVDTVAPSAPSLSASFTDSGVSGTDKITNANSATLSGVAEKGAPVQIFDGATPIATVTANASTGAWSYSATGLANGIHSFTAKQTDVAGNVSAASAASTMAVDTVAAAPSLVVAFVDSGVSATDKITNATTATLSGMAEAGATVKIYDGTSQIATVSANAATGAWTYNATNLANGTHSFTAKQTDIAGNVSAPSDVSMMTVDTTAPTAVPTLSAAFTDTGVSGTDKITNSTTATLSGTAPVAALVNVYDGSTLIATVTANSSGAWTYLATGLADGTHNFTAKQSDVAGNLSAASAASTMTVDTFAPAPSLAAAFTDSGASGTDRITNATSATLSGVAEKGAPVQIFDGTTLIATVTANASTGAWSYNATDLDNGTHSFTAKQTDIAGNVSAASAASTMTVDTVVAAPSLVATFLDAGASATDKITNATTATLSGTAEAGAAVKVYDGSSLIGTATADSGGQWTYGVTGLANGTHSFTAKQTDLAGNASGPSTASTMTVDTVAPSAPSLVATFVDSGASGSDKITNATTATLSGTALAGGTVTVYDGSTQIATVTANSNGAWTYTASGLADGTHSFTARQMDVAGNLSAASAARAMTVDTVVPAPTLVATFEDSGASGTDSITNATTAKLSGTAEAGATVKVYDGSTLIATVTANSSGQWTYNANCLDDGTHSYTARQIDIAGNVSAASAPDTMTVDTVVTAPSLVATFVDTGVSATDKITNATTATLSGTAEAGATVKVYDGSTLIGAVTADPGGLWTFGATGLANGTHSFKARQIDLAGNESCYSDASKMTVDTCAPTGVPTLSVTFTDTGVSGTDHITSATSAAMSGTAPKGAWVQIYDGSTLIATATANAGTGAWSYNATGLADGTHSFTARQADIAGNVSAPSAASIMTVDTVALPPVVALASDTGAEPADHITSNGTLLVTGTEPGATVQYSTDGGANWTSSFTAREGANSVLVHQTDVAGNISSATALAFTLDTSIATPIIAAVDDDVGAPHWTVPNGGVTDDTSPTLTGTAEAGSKVTVHDGSTALGTATADGSGAWVFTPAAALDYGPHHFTAQASDAAGNTSTSSAYDVTIAVNHAAVIGDPSVPSVTEDAGVSGGNLTATGSVTISDADAGQASFQTAVSSAPGNLGTLAMAVNGAYLYTVANSAVQYLGANDSKIDSFTISSVDGTAKTVSFTIRGADDAPAIGSPTFSSVTEDADVGSDGKLTATGSIPISDADAGQAGFQTSVISAPGNLGTLGITAGGIYTYSVANDTVQSLGAGDSRLENFTISSVDGTTKTVSFTIHGTNDAAVIGTPTVSTVTEDVGVTGDGNLTATGSISVSDVDAGQSIFSTKVNGVGSPLGALVLSTDGTYTYTVANNAVQQLGAGVTATDSFRIASADGTTQEVSFTIVGTNDVPVITANFGVTTPPNTAVTGSVTATDVDTGDTLVYTSDPAHTATHGTVTMATDGSGSYTYMPSQGYSGADSFNVIVSDGHGGNTPAAVSVNVTTSVNEPAIISGTTSGFVIEASGTSNSIPGTPTASGQLSATDADSPATFFAVSAPANHGSYTIDQSGQWNYALNNADSAVQALNVGQTLSDSFTVHTWDGTAQAVTITISGANDAAAIAGTITGTVIEAGGINNAMAGTPTATGQLNATDVDNPATFTAVTAASGHGSYTIDANGLWSYALDNADSAVQSLGPGQTLTDSFTAATADGTSQLVTVTINGANDAPVLAAPLAISYTDTQYADNFAAVTGRLAAGDVDSGATLTYGVTGGTLSSALDGYDWAKAGLHGTLYVNSASGAYSFTPDSAAIDRIPEGINTSDDFTLSVSDGAGGIDSQVLTVDLYGANDASVISGVTGPLKYTLGQPIPVVVAPALTLGDADSNYVTSAKVVVSAGFHAGTDFLGFQLPGNSPISSTFHSDTGVLDFTGTATLAEYQAALDSVTFHTSIIGARTISFTVFDGTVASITVDTSTISLENLTTTGFKIPGEAAGDNSGFSMHGAGDINGDGFSDVIIGALFSSPNENHQYAGRSYVVFGKGTAFDPTVPLWSLDGNNGSRLSGVAATDYSGFSVSGAGDVNGDGFSDVIIGAIYADPNGIDRAGTAYVVFGKATGFGSDFQLSALDGTTSGFRLEGAAAGDQAGVSVSGVGDVNGDGYDDVLVGSYSAPSGAAYLVFGKASGFAPNVQLSDLNGINGLRIAGENPHDNAGQRVSAAGDVNGDGFADFIIGAPGDFRLGYDVGAVYVVFGKASFFDHATAGATLELSTLHGPLADGTEGFRILGLASGDGTGIGINKAGDINGDGFGDVIVSARFANIGGVESGASYVVFGHAGGFGVHGDVDLSTPDGINVLRISGAAANSLTGYSVSAAGDVNGDGYGDLIVGAPGVYGTPSWSGESYVIFGKAAGSFSANIDLSNLGTDGVRLSGVANGDASGYSVSAAGDVNGDGFDDIAVSSARASPNGQTGAGESYVIFGAKLVTGGETYLGGPGNDTLTGTATNENFIGGQGNDIMVGNGGKDAFSGGAGDDTIHLGAAGQPAIDFIKINGGSGFDTLVLDGSGVTLDLTVPGVAGRIQSIERIDLGGHGNSLVLDIRDVINLSDTGSRLFVTGATGDAVTSTGQHWAPSASGQVTDHGIIYDSYTLNGAAYIQGMANLLIDHQLVLANGAQLS